MAYVAQKIEQLEMAMTMGAATTADVPIDSAAAQDDESLPTEVVHYNPSDLSTWLENMLSEFNNPSLLPPPVPSFSLDRPLPINHQHHHDQPRKKRHHVFQTAAAQVPPQSCLLSYEPVGLAESSSITTVDLPSPPSVRSSEQLKKRIKSTASPSTPVQPPPPTSFRSNSAPMVKEEEATVNNNSNTGIIGVPLVLADSQETGIRLVHALLGCAEAVQRGNLKAADSLVKQIGMLAMSQGGAMKKVATYFAEALARRIYQIWPQLDTVLTDALELHFYEACPYLKFAHFTANQAILEAFAGKSRVHVIDLSMKQGMQWPALMQALALRSEGPPFFRLTGIGPPQPDNKDALQQVGWRLAQLAETIHVDFEYRGFVANSLTDLEPCMLDLTTTTASTADDHVDKENNGNNSVEAVAINAVLELHRLLGRPGAVEKVLGMARAMNPNVVTIVEAEANHNGPVFCNRFTEALHYYSSMFDSLEGGCGGASSGDDTSPQLQQQRQRQRQQDRLMTEVYLGRQICNVVACEGQDRTERHETTAQWRSRMVGAGFEAVPLGSNAFKQASMLLELFAGGDGYRVEERDGCLMLGWQARPLITTSAWRASSSPPPLPTTGNGRRWSPATLGMGESPFPA